MLSRLPDLEKTIRPKIGKFIYINQSLQMLSRLPDLKKTIRPKIGKLVYLHQPESADVVSPPRPREDHQAKDW